MAWPLNKTKLLTFDDYTVAWICALPQEKTAARNMLDEQHELPAQPHHDKNIYTLGMIGNHNVVIVCQGDMGNTAATLVATRMDGTFRNLRFGLLVGIAGGIPDKIDIRLGDIVVSYTGGKAAAVVPTDRGKFIEAENGAGYLEPRPYLNGVPEVLRNTFAEMVSLQQADGPPDIPGYISRATERNSRFIKFNRPDFDDNLFALGNIHISGDSEDCTECLKKYESGLIKRPPRQEVVRMHFGSVASGSQVIKDGNLRAKYAKSDILAIEMEAAGLMDMFGCATIRGICDYADSHKNDAWQLYAAATAAACAKHALQIIPSAQLKESPVVPVENENQKYLQWFLAQLAMICPGNFKLGSVSALIELSPKRAPSTCEWILTTSEYKSFLSTSPPGIFWIRGGRGVGKTTLACFLIENITGTLHTEDTILYFFCNRNNERLNNATSIVAGLLWRLVNQQPALFFQTPKVLNHVHNRVDSVSKDEILDERTLWYIFINMMRNPQTSLHYCLIDGLDECDESSQIFIQESILKAEVEYPNLPKFIVTSNKLPRIRPSMILLDLTSTTSYESIQQDINRFIEHTANGLIETFPFLGTWGSKLIGALQAKSEDNFLLASLIADDIKLKLYKGGPAAVKIALETIPSGLSQYYDTKLRQLPPGPISKQISLWVALAKRPLTVHELAIGIGVSPRDSFTSEQVMKEYIESCAAIVTIDNDFVYFVNVSMTEYLCYVLEKNSPFAINTQNGHLQIAKRCLEYMNKELSLTDRKNWSSGKLQSRLPFLSYAALYFPDHARTSSSDIGETLDLQFFSSASPLCKLWLNVYCSLSRHPSLYPGIPVLHMLSCFGIAPLVSILLEKKAQYAIKGIDEKDDKGHTALQLALNHSHDAVVAELLMRGADYNIKYQGIRTNISYIRGDRNTVTQLPFLPFNEGIPTLHSVCYHGYGAGAEMLLNYGADVNRRSVCFALNITYIEGNDNRVYQTLAGRRLISLLLGSEEAGFSALHLAALRGHEGIVKLLLDTGADIDANVGHFPIQLAIIHGNGNVVNQSLSFGLGGNYASIEGNENIVQQSDGEFGVVNLFRNVFIKYSESRLRQGTEEDNSSAPQSMRAKGLSAVYLAAMNGHKNVVRMLRDKGAMVDEELLRGLRAVAKEAAGDTAKFMERRLGAVPKLREQLSYTQICMLLTQSVLASQL
ncbi:hypothetical protein F5Y14DRAFT_424372 [Nemania sp. NC0429]|nr:hypothetical protein F5Y14DRAFT_424372 [Nemania sp. NC0429]